MHTSPATKHAQNGRISAGFTLLEMSIVLVVVGLIIGGLIFGRTVLVTSRLKTVITDADNYITATANFKQQYQALPGDMASATTNWGTDSSGCPSGGGKTGTCNGNGDGMIAGVTNYEYEAFRFWQQLYLAGMLSQQLSGVASSGGVYAATIGTNVPAGSIDGSGFSPIWEGTIAAGNTNFFAGFYGHVLLFGGVGSTFLTSGPILGADQAADIDNKIDDGLPGTGKVRSFIYSSSGLSYAPNCATSTSVSTATYNVTTSGNLCALIFVTGF